MNIDILKEEQLEIERNQTYSDPVFQNWMMELNISQSWEDPTLKLNARDIQSQYDIRKYQRFFK